MNSPDSSTSPTPTPVRERLRTIRSLVNARVLAAERRSVVPGDFHISITTGEFTTGFSIRQDGFVNWSDWHDAAA